MIWHLFMVEDELGPRVARASASPPTTSASLGPLATQTLSEEELSGRATWARNGPRDVAGLTMTHCVPNERDVRVAGDRVAVAGD